MKKKLVRDRIPEIVGSYGHVSGEKVRFEQIDGPDLKEALERKLQEEAAEFLLKPNAEELADIIEVVEALKEFYPETERVRSRKALQKGRFNEGRFMLPVNTRSDTLIGGLLAAPEDKKSPSPTKSGLSWLGYGKKT